MNTVLTYLFYLWSWWCIGIALVLLTWKKDKKPVLVKDVRSIVLTGLLGLLVIPLWLLVTLLTWMQEHGDKRIF